MDTEEANGQSENGRNGGRNQDPIALQPLNIEVTKSEKRLDTDKTIYKMGSTPKGYALVISNEKFEGNTHKARDGGQIDCENIEKLLTCLGYKVTVKKNLTKNKMETAIMDFRNDPKHKKVDSAIVFILTHGEEDGTDDVKLITSDNSHVYADWIIKQFYGKYCPNLLGKPKLLFLQYTWETEKEEVGLSRCTDLQTDGLLTKIFGIKSARKYIPNDSDIMIVYASAPGFNASITPTYGSRFVNYMCKVFAEKAHNTELIEMLCSVGQELKNPLNENAGSEFVKWTNIGFKTFYFNPGLYDK